MKLSVLDWIAYILTIIGGINWGLVGLFELDLVDTIFGGVGWLAKLIYILVGLSALYLILILTKISAEE